MIITKKSLARRMILKGLGASVALPFLDAMVPAFAATATSAANPPTKFAFLYTPHGVHRAEWTPTTEGTGFEFTRILKPLEPLRSYVNVVSNLNLCQQPLPTGHFQGVAMWLNGTPPNPGAEVRSGKTIDQMIVEKYGQETALPSLEICTEDITASNGACDGGISCVYANTISWRDATTPLPMELDPKAVFERLFGDGGGDSPQDRAERVEATRSILDSITESTNDLRATLGAGDQTRLSDYFESVREIERRIQKSSSAAKDLTLPPTPAGVPDSFDEHARLLFDLMVLAFQGNVTRVISFMMARELSGRTYQFIGVPDGHHSTSHNGEMPTEVEKFVKINTYHVQVFADFMKKMQSIQDGDGSLLDHSMILYGSGMGNSNLHSHERLPIVVAGGASGQLKGGRHIKVKDGTPLSNLLVGFLDAARLPTGPSWRQQWFCATVKNEESVMHAKHIVGYAVVFFFCVSSLAAATTESLLFEAVKNRDSKTAHSLLERSSHLNVNVTDAQGMTPLLWAAYGDDLDMVKCLISVGANVKIANRFGSTALHEASTFGDVPMMEALLKAGADPNARRGQGDTPLMVAAHSAVPGAVALLLEHGAEVDARDGWYGETSLMMAVSQSDTAIAKVLIDHGADVNAASTAFNFRRRPMADAVAPINPPSGGLTPLFFAARQNAIETGKLLIAAGANLNAVEPGDRYTPLLTAIVNDNFDFASMLVQKGAKVDDGSLALVVVMRNGPAVNEPNDAHLLDIRPPETLDLMNLLISHGAPLDAGFNRRVIYTYPRTPRGASAFSMAASFVDVAAMHLLLDSGAHPVSSGSLQAAFGNAAVVTTGGMTPLMLVAQLDKAERPTDDAAYMDAVQMCVDAGVDVKATTVDGNTALHYAAGNGNDPIVHYLIDHGADINAKTKKGRTPLDWAAGKRPGGLGNQEQEAPRETTIALLRKLMSEGTTALNTSSQQ